MKLSNIEKKFEIKDGMINKTKLGIWTNDEEGRKYFETDPEKFPKQVTMKYIQDTVELEEPDLGFFKKFNWQFLNDDGFVVADLESTGFSPEKGGRIIEIGAVKIKDGKIVDRFSRFVNPGMKIPKKIQEITNITDDMVKDADYVGTVVSDFWEFCRGNTMVFHNAKFDWNRFLISEFNRIGVKIPEGYPCIDTLELDKELFPNEKDHKLNTMCDRLEIEVEGHHRAINDAEMTAKAFLKLREMSKEKYEHLRKTVWNTNKPKLDLRIVSEKKWEKKKKDGTIIKKRRYVVFVCNGKRGSGYYDELEKCWYIDSTEIPFNARELGNVV